MCIRLSSRFLVITEKPSSARKIAYALDDNGSPRNAKYGKVTFYLSKREEDELVVVSAVGHLYSIQQIGKGWTYPVFDIEWVPAYKQNKRASYTKQYLDAIIGLSRNMDGYVSACDYDQEGSLIAYNIIRHGIGENAISRSKRMLFSTLTSKELVSSWENRGDSLDYPVIAAGKTRHETDWLFGINLSRALTIAVRRYLDFKKVLSIGRVQGPTLKFVYDLEQEINSFIPIPYWKVSAETTMDDEAYSLEYEKTRLEREVHAKEVAKACRGKTGLVTDIKSMESRTLPPPPFNLGELQREAYRHFKMNPSATLDAAEKLYLGAYISYPRTESNKIPPSIDIKDILENLSKNPEYDAVKELIREKRFKPRQGKGDDPAHPAIHPTGQRPRRLNQEEQRIYDLIVRRFLASLGKPLIQSKTDASVDVNGYLFFLRGVLTQKPGWTKYYAGYCKSKDQPIPEITIGQKLPISKLSTRRMYTKPNSRYNASSLIRKMENEKVGTKATRSNIVDTLYRRDYIKGQQISITDLGENTIETLLQYCPEIIEVQLTRDLEEELEAIEAGEKDIDAVFQDIVERLKPILAQFKESEEQIGRTISNAIHGKESSNLDDLCKICHRTRIEGSVYCERHTIAYDNLEDGFKQWRYALGYQWLEYLEKIIKISKTGLYAKEIIKDILG